MGTILLLASTLFLFLSLPNGQEKGIRPLFPLHFQRAREEMRQAVRQIGPKVTSICLTTLVSPSHKRNSTGQVSLDEKGSLSYSTFLVFEPKNSAVERDDKRLDTRRLIIVSSFGSRLVIKRLSPSSRSSGTGEEGKEGVRRLIHYLSMMRQAGLPSFEISTYCG